MGPIYSYMTQEIQGNEGLSLYISGKMSINFCSEAFQMEPWVTLWFLLCQKIAVSLQ